MNSVRTHLQYDLEILQLSNRPEGKGDEKPWGEKKLQEA